MFDFMWLVSSLLSMIMPLLSCPLSGANATSLFGSIPAEMYWESDWDVRCLNLVILLATYCGGYTEEKCCLHFSLSIFAHALHVKQ